MGRRFSFWICCLATAGALLPAAQAQTFRYVSKSGSQTSPYNTWARAATNINVAAAGAGANTIIVVSNGVYALTNTITLANTITIRGLNGPASTTLEGNDTFRLFSLSAGAQLDGVTIRRGRAAGTGSGAYGGGVYANNARISNCVIQACAATTYGGGVYFFTGGGLLTHSRLENNESPYGGGVHCRSVGVVSNCVFENNKAIGPAGTGGGGAYLYQGGAVSHSAFRGNTAGNDGGGVLMDGGGTVDNCDLAENVAGDWGGGAAVYFTGGRVRNCAVIENRADEGGGIYFHQSGLLENSTVVDNQALQDGSGVKFSGGGTSVNSIIYFNAGDNYALLGTGQAFLDTCTTPALAGAHDQGGNIAGDPSFLYLPEDVLHLNPDSPCINAGTNLVWMAGATDRYGSSRQLGEAPDMGAYEFGPLVCHFVGTPNNGPPPLSVQFTNFVTGTNLTGLFHRWDAQNDGPPEATGSAASSFAYTYTNGGLYTVRLDVTNAVGQQATLIRTNYIFANLPHFVSTNGGHVTPFTSWATAATNLAAALAVAKNDGIIYVTNGTHVLQGEQVITQRLLITSVNGPTVTVFRGSGGARLFRIRSGTTLAGFTLRDGVSTGSAEFAHGGAVYLDAGGVLTNCILTANRATTYGGGAYLAYGGEVTHSVIHSNRAQLGGGLATYNGGMIMNAWITTNVALDRGGGVYLYGNSVLRNSILDRNAAVSNGGGAALITSGSTLQNCTLVSNRAASGGGVLCEDGGNVQNSIAYFNTATTAFPNWQTNAVVYNYGAIFQSSCLTPTSQLPGATACFTNDPLFVLTSGNPYGLSGLSPCVNRAAYLAWMSGAFDLLGTTRLVGGAPDVGALERILLALAITSPSSGTRLPFRQTSVQITGTAVGLSGQLYYTNRFSTGTVTGQLALASNWTFSVLMPRHGAQLVSISATDTLGNVASDTLTIYRNRNQLFVPVNQP
jgi:PKD repeat protein